MNTATSRKTSDKMVLLYKEVKAAIAHGPRKQLADVLLGASGLVVMWDATPIARELLPELSLHFSRMMVRGDPTLHTLHYVLVRETDEVVEITELALESWLESNVGGQRERQLSAAIELFRQAAVDLEPDGRKRAFRHIRLLNQELLPS
jgi:hypothetical protein